MNAVTNQAAIAEAIQRAQAEPSLNATLKGDLESLGNDVDQAGQAVCAIARLLQEDLVRKASGDSCDYLNDFTTGCLQNGLDLLSRVLCEKGEALEKIASKGRDL